MKFCKYIKDIVAQTVDESDLLLCAGVASIAHGIHQIYPPAAFIFTGIAFVCLAVVQAKGGN